VSAAGYSRTPLLKKLGVREGMHTLLVNAPADLDALNKFKGWKSVKRARTIKGAGAGPYDYIHYFSDDLGAYKAAARAFKKLLEQDGMVWISWPKKSSGVATTLGEADVRALGLKGGLVDIKICAVDEIWSGLKFVIPVKGRMK